MCPRTGCNLLPRLSDQHEQLDFSAKAFNPLVILRLLIIAAANQKGRTVHGTNALDRGIRVGALGVVIKLHAALLRHILDAVLDCLKTLQHFDNLIHRNTEA